MRIFKWSPYFRVDKESSVVPLWVSFPRLPVHLFQKEALFSIAQLLGHPLRLDDATSRLKRPSTARVQVEIDVLKERPLKVWIQMGVTEGFWQTVDYGTVPPYCSHCWHLGHHESQCHVQHPDLKLTPNVQNKSDLSRPPPPKPKQQYVVKQSVPVVNPNSSGLTEAQKGQIPSHVSPAGPEPVQDSQKAISSAPPIITPPVITGTVPSTSANLLTKPSLQDPMHSPLQSLAAQEQSTSVQPSKIPLAASPLPSNSPSPLADAALLADVVAVQARPPDVDEDFIGVANPIAPSPANDTSQQVAMEPTKLSVAVEKTATGAAIPTPSPLAAVPTYKHVLVPDAQEIGFSSTAIEESGPEHAIVVYQSMGHATASQLASPSIVFPMATSSNSQLQQVRNRWHPTLENDVDFNDSDYYQETLGSDELDHAEYEDTDDYIYEDITDGSEGTHMKKKKDRRKLNSVVSQPLATIDDFTDQSRLLAMRLRKRGRPPGSRNRTYFDVQRTISTRATKATSD